MCGICGVVGPALGATFARSSTPSSPPSSTAGPTRGEASPAAGAVIAPEPPRDHRPRHRRSADHQRGPHGRRRPERRDLQLPRAARGAAAARPRAALARRHGGHRPPRGGAPTGRARAASRRHVRLRRLGRAPGGGSCSAATGWERSRCTTGAPGGRLVFGSEIKAAVRRSRGAAAPRPQGDPRLPDLRLRPHAAHVLRGRAQPAARTRAHLRAGRRAGDRALLASRRSRASTATAHVDLSLPEAAAEVRSRLEDAVSGG